MSKDVILATWAREPVVGDVPEWTGRGWEPRPPSRQLQDWQTRRMRIARPGAGTAYTLQGWQFDGAFSVTDANTIEWTSGTLTFGSGESFSISAGNTGNMAADTLTYIYFDPASSTTALQTSTTASDAVGYNTILIAVAEAETGEDEPTYTVFGASGGRKISASQIISNTITANEIDANTITAGEIAAGAIDTDELAADAVTAAKIDVAELSAISVDAGNLTAGNITVANKIGLDGDSYAVWINDSTFGNDGIQLEYNGGNPRAYIGDGSNAYLNYDGTKLTWKAANTELDASGNLTATSATLTGSITASSGAIGGWTVGADAIYTSNVGIDSGSEDIWINDQTWENSGIQLQYNSGTPRLYVGDGSSKYMKFDGTDLYVSGAKLQSPAAGTNLELLGWTYGGTFSATDADTVEWSAETLTFPTGDTYSIDAGNTGNMAAITYIYFDKGTSETAFQTSTTKTDAVGANKVLIAVAQNNSDTGATEATFKVFSGSGEQLISSGHIAAEAVTANEIAANTITASEIATGTITATEITGSALSAIYADLGTITAGTINMYSDTWDSDATGFRLNADEICGQNSGTDQVLLAASTGKLTAGAGVVELSAAGIQIEAGASFQDSTGYQFTDPSDNVLSVLGGQYSAQTNNLQLQVNHNQTKTTGRLYLRAYAGDASSNVVTLHSDGYTLMSDDARVVGGLYVGQDADPDADDIHYDGNLKSEKTATHDVYAFHPLTTPYTNTNFDGDSFSDVGTSTKIDAADWSTTIPSEAKALLLRARARDSGSAAGSGLYFSVGPTATYYYALSVWLGGVADDEVRSVTAVCPCDDGTGDLYYQIEASGASTLDVWLEVWGYWI